MKNHLRSVFDTRQHMLSNEFELFFYDDSDFHGVKKHCHNYYEIYFFLSGDITLFVADQKHTLVSGDIIIIPPNIMHNVLCNGDHVPYRRFVLWINKDYFDTITYFSKDYFYIINYALLHNKYIYHNSCLEINMIHSRIFHLLETIYSHCFAKEAKILVSLQDLLLQLNNLAFVENENIPPDVSPDLFTNLLHYIENHLDENITLEQLSCIFFTNKYHIAHLFKEKMGISLYQFVLKKRLNLSLQLLLSQSNLNEIYQQVGFNDYSCFYRAFKKEYGISPKEYRDKNKVKLGQIMEAASHPL